MIMVDCSKLSVDRELRGGKGTLSFLTSDLPSCSLSRLFFRSSSPTERSHNRLDNRGSDTVITETKYMISMRNHLKYQGLKVTFDTDVHYPEI